MSSLAADVFLEHYGVKGMKWGVRRNPDRVTRAEKKVAKAAYKPYFDSTLETRLNQMFLDNTMSERRYSSLSTKDVTYKKGYEFYRTTSRKDEKLRDLTYFSTNQADRDRYKVVMPGMSANPFKKDYEYVYKTTQKLTSPSEKARVDAFIELLDEPSVQVGKKTLTGREVLKKAGYGRDVKRLDSHRLGLTHYNQFVSNQIMNTPLQKAHFKKLSDKGYSLIQDDHDRGVVSDDPVIVLNPNGSVKQMSVRQLSKRDIHNAKLNVKPVKQRER